MSFKLRPASAVDSYKTSHHKMYPKGTNLVYSNFTPRSDRIARAKLVEEFYDGKLVWVGGYGALKNMVELWDEEFFDKPKDEVCGEYASRLGPFAGGMEVDVSHFEALHDLGYLPINVRMIEEGNHVNMGIPVFTVHNTRGEGSAFGWLPNYLETWLSSDMWGAATVATIAMNYRRILEHYAKLTGSPMEFVDWQGHDFSARGMSTMQSAAMTGIGHLVAFSGTDTIAAVDYADWAYRGKETFVGGSVPASEHSVMTFDGQEGEFELFKRLITKEIPTGIVSLVSDGYDYWKVITEYARDLKDDILARQPDAMGFAKVVFRPDSGDPVKIVCGYDYVEVPVFDYYDMLNVETEVVKCEGKYYLIDSYDTGWKTEFTFKEISEAEAKGSIECLWDIFGGTITETGHKLLDSHVGLIYGDSITPQRCHEILERLHKKGFASANMVFGIGSYTYQYNTRDTFGFAMKATYGEVYNVGRNIFKEPKTDGGTKKSAKGILVVEKNEAGDYILLQEQSPERFYDMDHGELKLVLWDGSFVEDVVSDRKPPSLEEIRARARA